jgi:hypothetical protein
MSCTVIRRTPALAQRVSKRRFRFRGSNGVPARVVNTSPLCTQEAPSAALAAAWSFSRIRSAVTQMPGIGKVASEAWVLVSRWSSCNESGDQIEGQGAALSSACPC